MEEMHQATVLTQDKSGHAGNIDHVRDRLAGDDGHLNCDSYADSNEDLVTDVLASIEAKV